MDHHPVDLDVAPPVAVAVRALGEVAWYSPDRGFGFVRPDDGGEDVFLTWSMLPGAGFRTIDGGTRVSFLRAEDGHGPVARDVEVHPG